MAVRNAPYVAVPPAPVAREAASGRTRPGLGLHRARDGIAPMTQSPTAAVAPAAPGLQSLTVDAVGSAVHGAAALLWLPQAALLAWALQGLASGAGMGAVWGSAVGILVFGLLRALAEAWALRRVYAVARAHLSRLRATAAASLCTGTPLDRSRVPSGLAASALAEQAEMVVPYLARYQPARWRVVVVTPVLLVAVASQTWVAALVLMVTVPLIPLFMVLAGKGAQAASKEHMLELGGMNAFLLDRLRGLATLRALQAVDVTAQQLDDSAQSLRRRTMAVLRIAFLSSAVLELFSALGVAMVAVYVGFHLLGSLDFGAWGQRLGLGQGLFVLLLAPAFFEPLRELAAVWHDRAAGESALQALQRLVGPGVALPGGATVSPGSDLCPVPAGAAPSVAVRGLHFWHPGEAPVFAGLNLRVAAGEHVALLGGSGSGKTVLLSLLAGLVAADRGEILIGAEVLSDHNAARLRQRMGWMGQRPYVFADSVQANVSLGRADISALDVQGALRRAQLGSVVQARPHAALGEGGQGLSGGETARLALARLEANRRADLWLVDEPTAHLDNDTARHVSEALVAMASGKTLIVATHDPALAARMGRVVRLDGCALEQAA